MRRIMVDASAWIALYHSGDSDHEEAVALADDLARRSRLATTTHFALETHERLRHDRRASPEAPDLFAARCVLGDVEFLVPEDHAAFAAIVAAQRQLGPRFSLEDVSGALTMRALGIRTIWAWEEDFSRLGFEVVP